MNFDILSPNFSEFNIASHILCAYEMNKLLESESDKQLFATILSENEISRKLLQFLFDNFVSLTVEEIEHSLDGAELYNDLLNKAIQYYNTLQINFFNLNTILLACLAFLLKTAPKIVSEFHSELEIFKRTQFSEYF